MTFDPRAKAYRQIREAQGNNREAKHFRGPQTKPSHPPGAKGDLLRSNKIQNWSETVARKAFGEAV
jgi:hypothetical protein